MLPAYGRELVELRNSGKRPADAVFVTIDWKIADSLRSQDRFVLVMVAGTAPLDCSMLAGLDVIVLDALDWPIKVCRRALNAIRMGRPSSIEYRHWIWSRDDPRCRAEEERYLNELI